MNLFYLTVITLNNPLRFIGGVKNSFGFKSAGSVRETNQLNPVINPIYCLEQYIGLMG